MVSDRTSADGLVRLVLILLAVWLGVNIVGDVVDLLQNYVIAAGITLVAILWYLDWI